METNANEVPVPDGAADRVVMVDVLHHLYDLAVVAAKRWPASATGGGVAALRPSGESAQCWQAPSRPTTGRPPSV